jgi:hypothetical protein
MLWNAVTDISEGMQPREMAFRWLENSWNGWKRFSEVSRILCRLVFVASYFNFQPLFDHFLIIFVASF